MVLGNTALTLSDWRKRLAPDGSVDFIIEALMNANPIMDDIPWMMGNLPTGNKTTIRTSMPRPSIRRINRGVERHKTQTEQVTDTCIILEDRSVVDIELLALAANGEAFRRSEDAAFVAGFSDAVAANIFYGDTEDSGEQFNGISVRYSEYGDAAHKNKAAYQVISAGTPGTANTSGFYIGWGTHATTGIYPKNSSLGLQQRDLGEQTVTDADGREYQAVTTLFTWKCGLAVGDIRSNALVRNIDMAKLTGTMTSAEKLKLVEAFIRAKNRIRGIQSRDKKVVLYVGDELYNFFELYLLDKNNVHVTRQDLANAAPQLYLSGIPIKKCDAISEEEEAVPAAE